MLCFEGCDGNTSCGCCLNSSTSRCLWWWRAGCEFIEFGQVMAGFATARSG